MMKTLRIIGCTILVLAMAASAFAGNEGRIGTAGAQELRIPIGSRGVAMGGAAIAGITGTEAIFWNPAGVAEIEGTEAAFSYQMYIADINVNFAAVATQVGDFGTVGLSAKVLSMDDIDVTSEVYPEGTGEVFAPAFSVFALTYSRRLTDRIAFGMNAMYVNENIFRETASGMAFDFGFNYDPDFAGLTFGAVIKNWGPEMRFDGADFDIDVQIPGSDPNSPNKTVRTQATGFELPSSVQLGMAYELVNQNRNMVIVNGTYQSNNFNNDEIRFGGEYGYDNIIFLRGGYSYSNQEEYLEGLTLGLGLGFHVGETRMVFDYSWAQTEYFDDKQFYTVKVQF